MLVCYVSLNAVFFLCLNKKKRTKLAYFDSNPFGNYFHYYSTDLRKFQSGHHRIVGFFLIF